MTFTVRSAADLQAGDIGFTSIRGRVGAGVLAAQTGIDLAALLRDRRADSCGWITHAFVVDVDEFGPRAIEAMPSGARAVDLGQADRTGPGYVYVRLPISGQQRAAVAQAAREMQGIPYGFAQYAAIAGLTLAGGQSASPRGPLARYVQRREPVTGRPRRAICSQLVDEAYRRTGVQLFDDGRPPAYVTPGALFWRAAQIGEICVCA